MIKNKKSQGMPINVIIIAALGLIVLFVLIIIFTGQSSKTVSTLESCAGIAGQCREAGNGCLEGETEKSDAKCPQNTQTQKTHICCIKI